MTNLFSRFYNYDNPHLPVLPEPQLLPEPGTEGEATLQAVKSWCHPFRDKRDPLQQLTHLASATGGSFPLGGSGLWHGGVHFDAGTAGTLDQSSVHCMADGEVVAYRIDEHCPTTPYYVNKQPVRKPFSRNFVLVRHLLQPPAIDGNPYAPPSLVFYSLYMHLQDWAIYQADPAIARPAFWSGGASLKVKSTVKDLHPDHPGQHGLNVRHAAHKGNVIGWLQRGTNVTVSGNGTFRRLENVLGPDRLMDANGSLRGYVAAEHLKPIGGGQHRVACQGTLNVRDQPQLHNSTIIGVLHRDTEVTVSGQGKFLKLARINQYVHFPSLEHGAAEPQSHGSTVVLETPVSIKAGDLIGHLGVYHEGSADYPEHKLHLEVFTGADLNVFLASSRLWAEQMPASSKTWLKLVKGTPVVAHQDSFSPQQPPTLKGNSTPSDAPLLVPKSLLDSLPAERKIHRAASGETDACNWYRLENLLHDDQQTLLDGWVREDVGVTPWVNPWAWDGYDILYNHDSPQRMLASFMRATKRLREDQLPRYSGIADSVDKGPIKARLYDIVDRNRDGTLSAEEIHSALQRPAHAQSIAQLIIHYQSEWHHTPGKWDQLDDLLGHSGSIPHLNWMAEKERITALGWWSDVAAKVGLPADGKVFHMHPVGLISRFQHVGFEFTLDTMKALYPSLPSHRDLDLKSIADELNSNISFYKLDTPARRTHFFAQILEETGGDLAVEENFTFGAESLVNLFSYFKKRPDEARKHGYSKVAGKIKENGLAMENADYEAIANGAYGSRSELGNRGHASGDGWKYRGRGLKQLTGRYNYSAFNEWHKANRYLWPKDEVDFIERPELLTNIKYATRSAAFFWLNNKIHEVADKGKSEGVVDLVTDIVNKRTQSRESRKTHFKRILESGVML